MIDIVKKIFALFSNQDRMKLYMLVVAIIVMALFDMIGVASIFPFLNVISDPDVIETNSKLNWAYKHFGFSSTESFLIALGIASFLIMFISNIFRAGISIALIRFSWAKRYTICEQLLARYLHEPYAFFLNRNTSELTAYLASEVARVVTNVIIPCMQIFARTLLTLLILALLFAVDPTVASVIVVIIGGGYAVIYAFTRKRLEGMGKDISVYSKEIFKALNEAFGGIKDVKLSGKERAFIEKYSEPMRKSIPCYCSQFLIHQFPRYAFEVLAFGGIMLMTIYLVAFKNNYQQVIPIVGLYALAAYRLMPALQQIFHDLTLIRFGRAALDNIYEDYMNCKNIDYKKQAAFEGILPFTKSIQFSNITFQYPKAQTSVIEEFNLDIKAKTTVGFVGGTGAGKTTVIDILLGLLRPQEGKLSVDGAIIDQNNLRSWQRNIGYVPQDIYLCDDSITRNIAFGSLDGEIDQQAVMRAAQMANIHDFITSELPNGYDTAVGERGVRLSGGQKQRIGIARALYHDPSLFVFDEATSALDGITENTILEAIYQLAHKKTLIIVAHRLSTVKECDVIYMLEKGKIIAEGTYEELMANNRQFRKMANVSEYASLNE